MTSTLATCSMQDFMSHMAHYDIIALSFCSPYDRTTFNRLDAMLSNSLHEAMGYRAEHLQEDQF